MPRCAALLCCYAVMLCCYAALLCSALCCAARRYAGRLRGVHASNGVACSALDLPPPKAASRVAHPHAQVRIGCQIAEHDLVVKMAQVRCGQAARPGGWVGGWGLAGGGHCC